MLGINPTDAWAIVVGIFGTPTVTAFLVKKFGKPVEKEIVNVVHKAEPLVKELVDTPAVKLELDKAQHEIGKLTDQLKESELGKAAAIVLNAFDETLSELSSTQKEAVILEISNMTGNKFTKQDIESVLDDIQKASDSVSEVSYIKTANQFKQDVQSSQTVSA